MALVPEWTWCNILLLSYFVGMAIPVFKGQAKAEDGAVVWGKFARDKSHTFPVSARIGYLCKYVPAFMFIVLRITVFNVEAGIMEFMMLTQHGKRICEVLFVHDFGGSPIEDGTSSICIGMFYSFVAWVYCRGGAQAEGLAFCFGVSLFCAGIVGNLYHHILLARLRDPTFKGPSDESGKYKIPIGGLFELVTCPHYFFECMYYWGAAITAFNLIPMSVAANTSMMLAGHATSTTRWYQSKFGNQWPEDHIVPCVF